MKLHPAIFASALIMMAASSVFAQKKGAKESEQETAHKLSQVQEVSTNSGRAMLVVAGEVAN